MSAASDVVSVLHLLCKDA